VKEDPRVHYFTNQVMRPASVETETRSWSEKEEDKIMEFTKAWMIASMIPASIAGVFYEIVGSSVFPNHLAAAVAALGVMLLTNLPNLAIMCLRLLALWAVVK